MSRSKQQNWLITGVSSGFGRALAEAVIARGDRVFGSVRRDEDARQFEKLSADRTVAVLFDVTDEAAVHREVRRVDTDFGGIDVLVNNAGYGLVAGVEEAALDEVRAQFEVNVIGALTVMQAVLPFMRARRAGRIVNITSVSGLVGWPSLGIYSGSKFALEGITETLAQEVAPLGIRVMLIEPGGFRTDFAGRSRARSRREIADYDETVGACRRILAEHAGHERGDPRRAATAIITAATAESPPLRLLLGQDAIQYTHDKLHRQLEEISAWQSLSTSTDFDA